MTSARVGTNPPDSLLHPRVLQSASGFVLTIYFYFKQAKKKFRKALMEFDAAEIKLREVHNYTNFSLLCSVMSLPSLCNFITHLLYRHTITTTSTSER